MPTFEKPSVADLRHAADQLGMNPSMMYLNAVQDIVAPLCAAYAALDAFPDEKPAVKYPRDGGWRPNAAENPLNAWYYKTSIKGKASGKLAGRRVALKDNVCLAGVPMMVGAQFLEGTVPDIDATIVERILDAGGEIAGKAVCEYYCVSGGSHTSSTGPVQNPRKHGFGHSNSEPDVDAKVRAAAERFKSLGATVAEVSVPEHLTLGFPVWAAIRGDAACVTLLEMNGFGLGYEGLYPVSAIEAAMKWRDHADEFADTLKIATLLSKYTLHRYGGHYYAKAQNLRRRLRAAYDAALTSHDLLLLPTAVMKATPIPGKNASPQEITRRSWEATRNTCPFNVTDHPAISIPCGMEDGRPIGLMLVGKHWDERTIYRASEAFERSGDWMRF